MWFWTGRSTIAIWLVGVAANWGGCARRAGGAPADGARGDESADGAAADTGDAPDGNPPRSAALQLACGSLLDDSLNFLRTAIDRGSGLPFDQLPCGGPYAGASNGFNRAFGVIPQLAYAQIDTFTEDPTALGAVSWSFDETPAGGELPDFFYALKIGLRLHDAGDGAALNRFGGVIWGANTSVARYARVQIRYRTATAGEDWQLKLNAGSPAAESAVDLPASETGGWVERSFSLHGDFSGIDLSKLNYLVVATSQDRAGQNPTIWIDRVAFLLDTGAAAACGISCAPGAYPDLACYEPQTGVVDIANALSAFAIAPAAGRMAPDEARTELAKILSALEAMPVGMGWMADWHSPVSGGQDPRNPIASLTDQPQLYAALMVVESSFPDLAARAAALRARFDFRALYEAGAGGPGSLHWATDTCGAVQPGQLEVFGNDSLLGEFLAVASAAAPISFWTEGLARRGCSLDGPADAPWYTTGRFCNHPTLPGADTGGPFLQLAPLLYLDSDRLPMGQLSLGASAAHMLESQARYATAAGLPFFGWSNSSDPDRCEYLGCGAVCSADESGSRLCAAKVTPYISAMGLDRLPEIAAQNLAAFAAAGPGAPFYTSARSYRFGLRDAWNLATGSGRDAFLYLDTGWTVLGLLNACHGDLLRRRFADHPVARAGYAALAAAPPACAARDCGAIQEVRIAGLAPGGEINVAGPVKVDWTPSWCPALVRASRGGAQVFPVGAPDQTSLAGVELPLTVAAEPYDVEIAVPGVAVPSATARVRVGQRSLALDEQPSGWRACREDPAAACDGGHPSCCTEPAPGCGMIGAPLASEAMCAALRLDRQGAGNCHFYFNLPSATASAFSLTLRFRIDERGTCDNVAAPSSIQAVEFSISDWTGAFRHEWALQWENVAETMSAPAPLWRLWQPGAWRLPADAAVMPSCLAQGEWHRLRLDGVLSDGQARYRRASVDCQEVEVAGVPAATLADGGAARVAVAVQLDVASGAPSYAVLIDDVDLRLEP